MVEEAGALIASLIDGGAPLTLTRNSFENATCLGAFGNILERLFVTNQNASLSLQAEEPLRFKLGKGTADGLGGEAQIIGDIGEDVARLGEVDKALG